MLGFQFLFVMPVIELPAQIGRGKGEEWAAVDEEPLGGDSTDLQQLAAPPLKEEPPACPPLAESRTPG